MEKQKIQIGILFGWCNNEVSEATKLQIGWAKDSLSEDKYSLTMANEDFEKFKKKKFDVFIVLAEKENEGECKDLFDPCEIKSFIEKSEAKKFAIVSSYEHHRAGYMIRNEAKEESFKAIERFSESFYIMSHFATTPKQFLKEGRLQFKEGMFKKCIISLDSIHIGEYPYYYNSISGEVVKNSNVNNENLISKTEYTPLIPFKEIVEELLKNQ